MGEQTTKLEPYLMTILAHRFEAIIAEMRNTLIRSARSGIMNTGGDIACAIVTVDDRSICQEVGCPSLSASLADASKPIKEFFDDVAPGDCFLNNSPYHGNTHHADYTFMVPVFYKGKHVFTALARGHQADIGNSMPSTYMPFAKDIYEEGALNFPCVRVQRNYQDVQDIIRMAKMRIRVPEQWYGDYLACIGAARTGEKRLVELCDKYGVDAINQFVEEWLDYSTKFMISEIKKFPKVTLEGEIWHDPIEGIAPEGVPIRAKMMIDPDEGYITVDLTNNIDQLECGYNLCEGNTKAAVYSGIINNLSGDLPNNDGTASRIKMIFRDGAIIGRAKHPVCSSISTTDFAGRLTNLVQVMLGRLGISRGLAAGSSCANPSCGVISGKDFRYGNRPFINQILIGHGGGPALRGHDGWLTYMIPAVAGTETWDSIEIDEAKYPILVEHDEIEPDSGGAGQWDGAPGFRCIIRPRGNPAIFSYWLDSKKFPAEGIFSRHSGSPSSVWKVNELGEIVALPDISAEVIKPTEKIGSIWAGGGGHGDPLDRDPAKVRLRVRNGWVSLKKALEVYGVVLDTEPEEYAVDYEATQKLRAEIKKERAENK